MENGTLLGHPTGITKSNTYHMYKDFLVMKIGTLEQESVEMIITDKGSG